MDRKPLIDAVYLKYGIRLDKDDPAFILVDLNKAALEQSILDIEAKLEPVMRKLESRLETCFVEQTKKSEVFADASLSRFKLEIERLVRAGLRQPATPSTTPADLSTSQQKPVIKSGLRLAACGLVVASLTIGYATSTLMQARQNTSTDSQTAAAQALAELGQAKQLFECKAPGWVERSGYCYATALDGKVTGWRIR
jgi:hypothetical protein